MFVVPSGKNVAPQHTHTNHETSLPVELKVTVRGSKSILKWVFRGDSERNCFLTSHWFSDLWLLAMGGNILYWTLIQSINHIFVELYPSPPDCCHLISTVTVTSKGLSILLSGQFWMVGYMVIIMDSVIEGLLSGDSRFNMEACRVFVKISKLSLNGWRCLIFLVLALLKNS